MVFVKEGGKKLSEREDLYFPWFVVFVKEGGKKLSEREDLYFPWFVVFIPRKVCKAVN